MREMVSFSHYAQVNVSRKLQAGQTYPFVEMAAVPEGGGSIRYVKARNFDGSGARFAVGDTLFARITPCTENGKVARVDELDGSSVGFGSTEFIVLSPIVGQATASFVYQVAASGGVRNRAVARMLGSSGRQRVPDWFFSEELLLPLYSVPEQEQIAEVLDAIDAAIEKTEAVIAATQEVRRALLHELLTRGVPGWHSAWKDVPGVGTVPACWEVVRLGDVAAIQTGRAVSGKRDVPTGTGELPYLSVANVKDGYVDLTNVKSMLVPANEIARFRLERGDVLFTEGGDADKLGRGCVWDGQIDPCLHQNHVFAVRPNSCRLLPHFLAFYARSNGGKAYFLSCAKQTTNLASINSTQLREFPLPLPTVEEQQKVIDVLVAVATANENLAALRALKAAAAEALLMGRVRVKVGASPTAPNREGDGHGEE